ncbi:MAG TPA: hypothetical protein VFQ84_06110 [Arenimonas sp.]|uniref:hypothetical protein n=1 Tax=Arenimonas sp. TaxID=1872635 RepID=UPI002D7EA929|nr:hypothetical protein [Arenimonas sp.]HEU0152900.1 hypothetical protein [Arenimonas sp.]
MKLRTLFLSCLLALPLAAQARIAEDTETASLAQRADAEAEKITDAEAFVDEIDESLALAREGTYGRLKRGSMAQAETARNKIADLLEGHENAMELQPDERIELYNAQELITAMIRNDDKGRMVCKKEIRLGSRFPTTECLTVAQREEKARGARSGANDTLRNVCIPGEGQACAR